jgi:hypothetical protein
MRAAVSFRSSVENRRRFLDAAKHYGLALKQKPQFKEAAVALRRVQSRLN